jgi:beta-glucosidase
VNQWRGVLETGKTLMFKAHNSIPLAALFGLLLAACHKETPPADTVAAAAPPQTAPTPAEPPGRINPENWPLQDPVIPRDPAMENRIADLLARMTLEEKVGQVIQADIASVTPDDVRQYNLGSILNGGGSAPDGDLRNTPDSWLALADAFWEASTDTSDGGVGIPAIWGTDAVHGHSNIVGATIFPHNIGLGAANDPDLMYEIGRVTSIEMLATGLDWTFAPTIAVVRNDRWGRTYEGFSEDPAIVVAYAPRMVEGIQGILGSGEFLDESRMIATAKHFAGDGGTFNGIDQGDNRSSEADFRDIHAAAYPAAIAAGVQVVMASYNSYHGRKMHGSRTMLTDVLRGRMGFDGFVVGDWNGHGQVEGCSNDSCAAAFNAGLDMFMAPNDWKALYENTLDQVRSGAISEPRLDEAVARILRVKFRAHVFDKPRPSERRHAGEWALLGAPEHRAIAREAARKSLVLLKNQDGLLPLNPATRVLVAGDGADDIGKQCGGWTLSWQGTGNSNEHFPNGASIFEGIRDAVETAGGVAELSVDGNWSAQPDVAIVVFGENPYAETQGDRANVDYDSNDGLEILRRLRAAGIPSVSVFISGRPLWVNPELNASDAFVAAWLPGTEGGAVADVLFTGADGEPRFDFAGRLSFSWPATAGQVEVNVGDDPYEPLFAYGYGLSHADTVRVPELSEDPDLGTQVEDPAYRFIDYGDPAGHWQLALRDAGGEAVVTDARGASPAGLLSVAPADYEIQEDTFIATWTGPGQLVITGPEADLGYAARRNLVLELSYRVLEGPADSASFSMGAGRLDMTGPLSRPDPGWRTTQVPLGCFIDQGADLQAVTEPLLIASEGPLALQIKSAGLVIDKGGASCDL